MAEISSSATILSIITAAESATKAALAAAEFAIKAINAAKEAAQAADKAANAAKEAADAANVAKKIAQAEDKVANTTKEAAKAADKAAVPLMAGPRTVAVTIQPDWIQSVSNEPASICVVFGPPDLTPENASWIFEFNLFSVEKNPMLDTKENNFTKYDRALLWYNNQPFPPYKSGLVLPKVRFQEDLRPHSIVFRVDSAETEPNTLIWHPEQKASDPGYLKIVHKHYYNLNITFPDGATVHRYVIVNGWRFSVWLYNKSARRFTGYSTAWVNGIELDANEKELKAASKIAEKTNAVNPISCHGEIVALEESLKPIGLPEKKHVPYEDYEKILSVDMTTLSTEIPNWKPINYKIPFSLEPIIENFHRPINSTEELLCSTLCNLEAIVRSLSNDSKSPFNDSCKILMNFFNGLSQLPGWRHVYKYIENTTKYVDDGNKDLRVSDTPMIPNHKVGNPAISPPENNMIEELQNTGVELLRRLINRVVYMLRIPIKTQMDESTRITGIVKVLASDKPWMDQVVQLMNNAENKVTDMLAKNPEKFANFRELQKKGVQWPHSPHLRREIERAGFVFRPMMIKRDRCVCDTCSVEVSGWRPWHNPMMFHDEKKHRAANAAANATE